MPLLEAQISHEVANSAARASRLSMLISRIWDNILPLSHIRLSEAAMERLGSFRAQILLVILRCSLQELCRDVWRFEGIGAREAGMLG